MKILGACELRELVRRRKDKHYRKNMSERHRGRNQVGRRSSTASGNSYTLAERRSTAPQVGQGGSGGEESRRIKKNQSSDYFRTFHPY